MGIAQGFSDLPLYSGLGYRLVLWFLGTAIIVGYVMVYAEKVRKHPELSPVRELDLGRGGEAAATAPAWGRPQKSVLLILAAGMLALVYGILVEKWYMEEIAALFLAMGLLAGFAGRLAPSRMAESFVAGARDMMNVAFIIALGRSVLIVLQQAMVLDTILYYSGGPDRLGAAPAYGPDHVPDPKRHQFLHPLRHRPGGPDHAGHGAPERPDRHHAPDHGPLLPAVRVHQPHPAHLGGDHGRPGRGAHPLGEVGQVAYFHASRQ